MDAPPAPVAKLRERGSPVAVWDPAKPPNLAKVKAGVLFDIKNTCGPVGMPRVMTLYEPMEIVIRPRTTYMLLESMSPIRRTYTDGRDEIRPMITR